jgi:3-(3-hydroxy-phenyl)propionate hydroxylase
VPPVVIVGAGPTGVVAAILLAQRRIPCVLLERHTAVYALPRAVHLDDEVHRILQNTGVAEEFAAISRPALGLRLVDGRQRVLAEFSRSAAVGAHGYPQANMFDQPELEALLRAQLARQPLATLRDGVEVLAVEPATPPRVRCRDLTTGEETTLTTAAVLGCDGAGSLTRGALGGGWEDLGFEEPWLVVDARCRTPLGAWEGVHQVCDPARAATFMRVGQDRYRWEFQLRPGESVADLTTPARLAELLRPWTHDVPAGDLEILRQAGYTFEAGLARSWRSGRVFLLGDAAHLTPPFIGQGLGAGLRDAANLAWKLARVLHGQAPEELLDSYQPERKAHTRSLIRLAKTAGWVMTGGQGRAAIARRLALGALCRVPGFAERVLDTGTPALSAGPLVVGGRWPQRRLRHRLVGTLVPQPHVEVDGQVRRLDDVLGDGFAVLTTVAPDTELVDLANRLEAPVLTVPGSLQDGGVLGRWLDRGRATTVLIRPDRTVLAMSRSRSRPGADLVSGRPEWLRLLGASDPPTHRVCSCGA